MPYQTNRLGTRHNFRSAPGSTIYCRGFQDVTRRTLHTAQLQMLRENVQKSTSAAGLTVDGLRLRAMSSATSNAAMRRAHAGATPRARAERSRVVGARALGAQSSSAPHSTPSCCLLLASRCLQAETTWPDSCFPGVEFKRRGQRSPSGSSRAIRRG
eukprot:714621-Pleurochrysis_carterae.AAC.2